MGVRLYDSNLGRFLEVDPVEGGCSSDYVYVNDPVNSSDLSGMGAIPCNKWKKIGSLRAYKRMAKQKTSRLAAGDAAGRGNMSRFVVFASQHRLSIPAGIEAMASFHLWRTGRLASNAWWRNMDAFLARSLGEGALWAQFSSNPSTANWARRIGRAHTTPISRLLGISMDLALGLSLPAISRLLCSSCAARPDLDDLVRIT